jgi:hypothetical protein
MTQLFTDHVVIHDNEDIEQLRVQGHSTQTTPLQTWETNAPDVLAQITGDGRLQIGDDLSTPDSLVEAHRAESSTSPKRGIHTLGRITNLLADIITWAVAELELWGSNGVSGLQTAFRAKLTQKNTGTSTSAELRAGDFQVINQTGTSGSRVNQAKALRATASNDPSAYLTEAVAIEAAITNASGGNITTAVAVDVEPVSNSGTIGTLIGLKIPDLTQGSTNYAIQTGQGQVQFGDAVTANLYKVAAATQLTINTDAATVNRGFHTLQSQTGTTDDLKTLNGGSGNTFVTIQAASGHTITIKHGTGNIFLNGGADFILSGDKTLVLFFDSSNWSDIGAGGGTGGGGGSSGTSFVNDFRLTPTTAKPLETGTVSGFSTIYCTPSLRGNQMSLYNGTSWDIVADTEKSVAVPSTVFCLFDIFAYKNGSNIALETVNWNQTTGAITGATNATPVVVTSNAHGLSVGDVVGIAGMTGLTSLNSKLWTITAVTTNTFTLGSSVGNGTYTSGGTWYKVSGATRATALTTQNGRYVKSGDATRLYLGTGCTNGTSGQSDWTLTRRWLYNWYNREIIKVRVAESAGAYSYSSSTWRQANASQANQIEVLLGIESWVQLQRTGYVDTTNSSGNSITAFGIGFDTTTGNSSDGEGRVGASGSGATSDQGSANAAIDIAMVGLHIFTMMERRQSGSVTPNLGGAAAVNNLFGDLLI